MRTNRSLAVIAHGSRNENANQEFLQLVCDLAGVVGEYEAVRGCFLELAEPSLAQAVEELVNTGADHIQVYPLFFNQGKHVARDIPALVDEQQQRFPEHRIELLSYFGSFDGLARMIRTHLQQLTG